MLRIHADDGAVATFPLTDSVIADARAEMRDVFVACRALLTAPRTQAWVPHGDVIDLRDGGFTLGGQPVYPLHDSQCDADPEVAALFGPLWDFLVGLQGVLPVTYQVTSRADLIRVVFLLAGEPLEAPYLLAEAAGITLYGPTDEPLADNVWPSNALCKAIVAEIINTPGYQLLRLRAEIADSQLRVRRILHRAGVRRIPVGTSLPDLLRLFYRQQRRRRAGR